MKRTSLAFNICIVAQHQLKRRLNHANLLLGPPVYVEHLLDENFVTVQLPS